MNVIKKETHTSTLEGWVGCLMMAVDHPSEYLRSIVSSSWGLESISRSVNSAALLGCKGPPRSMLLSALISAPLTLTWTLPLADT